MNFKRSHLVALLVVLYAMGASWAASSQDEAKRWLERMIEATQTLSYIGTFVYVQGQTLEAMRIIHSNAEGKRQRLFSLNGSVREIVVRNNHITCVFPKKEGVFSGANFNRSPFYVALPHELNQLGQYYRFKIIGDDRVAGMETRVIAIEPRDEWRFGYRLWLDHDTGMVLRSALFDEVGQVIEQLMFTDLQIKQDIDPALLSLSEAAKEAMPPKAQIASEPVRQSNWRVAKLPAGFSQVMHNRLVQAADEDPTEHIVFTDGLATVSVFLEKLNGAKPLLNGTSRMGAMNALGVVIDDYQALVVGDVPSATVEMIATSLQWAQGAAVE